MVVSFFFEFLFNTTFKRSNGSSRGLDIVKNIKSLSLCSESKQGDGE